MESGEDWSETGRRLLVRGLSNGREDARAARLADAESLRGLVGTAVHEAVP